MGQAEIEKTIFSFLEENVPVGQWLLVGYSGGLDSTALLKGLTAISQWPIHVVHVNHGWREESGKEAREIEGQVRSLGLAFSCVQLSPPPEDVNLEEWSRNERYRAFLEIGKKIGTKRLIVAHQADDQIEVVCKRFLEGASITKFCGMRPVEELFGLQILRPLLSVRRCELQKFLGTTHYIDDPTNRDRSFLRARMREEIFPFLSRSFGKNVMSSIHRVSKEAALLEQFAHEKMDEICECFPVKGGVIALLEETVHPFIAGVLIDTLSREAKIPALSRQQRDLVVQTLCYDGCKRALHTGGGVVFVERQAVIALSKQMERTGKTVCEGRQGETTVGSWSVQWSEVEDGKKQGGGWQALFQGEEQRFYIPKGSFLIRSSNEKLLRKVRRKGVPISLRPYVPCIVQGFELVVDPLSGYNGPMDFPCTEIRVKLI